MARRYIRKRFLNAPVFSKLSHTQTAVLEARLLRLRDTGADMGLMRLFLINVLPEALDSLSLPWLPPPEAPPPGDMPDPEEPPEVGAGGPIRLEIPASAPAARRSCRTAPEFIEDRHVFATPHFNGHSTAE